jgi:hypothetical protein
MANTTAVAVQTLLGDAYDSNYAVTSFITTSYLVVTKHCTHADLTTTELEEIERYLAAHFYCITHRRNVSEKIDTLAENKQHVEGLGLDVTEFGQMAKMLDWSGALASLDNAMKNGKRRSVSVSWAGKENDESTELELLGL